MMEIFTADTLIEDLFPPLPPSPLVETSAKTFIRKFVLDPEMGKSLDLHPEQEAAIDFLTATDEYGNFLGNTLLYCAPKKSGKTTIAGGIALWMACLIPNGQVYVIGNDLKQADSRLFRVIEYTVKNNPLFKGMARVINYQITLWNGTVIEALPLDPKGESGMNPTCIVWTEAWGAKGRKAEEMWTEAALSPTRQGKSFKLVESYAGHTGESIVLERLYNDVVKDNLLVDREKEFYINPATSSRAYWCTRHIQPWQNDEASIQYYASEMATKTPPEFDRQHWNKWVSSVSTFIDKFTWDDCGGDLPPRQDKEYMVIAIDAATTDDCFAAVGVTRRGEDYYLRYCRIWTPEPGIKLDFDAIEETLYNDIKRLSVVHVSYDPTQMHGMAQRLQKRTHVGFYEFGQGTPRLIADKGFQLLLKSRSFHHGDNPELKAHVLAANSQIDKDESKLRIVKRNADEKIDAAVAASMACAIAGELGIG